MLFGVMIMATGCSSVSQEPKEIARVPYHDGHCVLREDMMVIITTPSGLDMLPVSLVSQELVDAFTVQLETKKSQ